MASPSNGEHRPWEDGYTALVREVSAHTAMLCAMQEDLREVVGWIKQHSLAVPDPAASARDYATRLENLEEWNIEQAALMRGRLQVGRFLQMGIPWALAAILGIFAIIERLSG